MIVVTILDVEELNSKLVSDRAKVREEGLKALQGYLNSSGDVSLWTLLDRETASLDQSLIRSASWPGVLHALCVCIEHEVAASKKKVPKLVLAKTFRSFVLKADDTSRAGQRLNLLRKVKKLFQHVVHVIEQVPTFVPDYNNVLCQLLPVLDYRTRMSKKIYADLLHFYLEKAKDTQNITQEASSTREETFRNISTLLCVLQHPPGDLPEILLGDVTQDFVNIFSKLRDEGRIAKKLLAALNAFITGHGLNIGDAAGDIHTSLRPFLVRVWPTTRDRELKDGLILYVRAQLNLRYILSRDDSEEICILLDLVEKDLDQTGISMAGVHRLDAGREDKAGFVTKAMRSFFELAAVVLFEASKSLGIRSSNASKRRKQADVTVVIKERLMEGKFMWGGAFCLLIRRFGSRLPIPVVVDWLEGLAASLDRIILEGVNSRNFEGPIWTLRSVQELAILWGKTVQPGGSGLSFPHVTKGKSVWKSVWNAVLHWLPVLGNVQVMLEEAFRLLGTLAAQSLIPPDSIPQDFWDLHRFSEVPSGNLLYFITSLFAAPNFPMLHIDLGVRKKLLDWCLSSLDAHDVHRTRYVFAEQLSPRLLTTAVLCLAFGIVPGTSNVFEHLTWLRKELSWPSCEREPYLEPDESEQAQELELAALDRSDGLLVSEEFASRQVIRYSGASMNYLPRSSIDPLLRRATDNLLKNVILATDATRSFTLSQLLHLSTVLANCIQGVEDATNRWGQPPSDWCCKGAIWEGLANILERNIIILDDIAKALSIDQSLSISSSDSMPTVSQRNCTLQLFSASTLESVREFMNSVKSCAFVTSGGTVDDSSAASTPLLIKLLKAARNAYLSAGEAAAAAAEEIAYIGIGLTSAGGDPRTSQNSVFGSRIIDSDLDTEMEPGILGGDAVNVISSGMSSISTFNSRDKAGDLRCSLLQVMGVIGKVMPDATCATLSKLLLDEKDPKVQGDILLSLCRTITATTCNYLTVAVSKMRDALSECQQSESIRHLVITAMDLLFSSLLLPREEFQTSGGYDGVPKDRGKVVLPEQLSLEIAELIGKILDTGLLLWPTRMKLVGAISQFIVLNPSAAQVLTDKFLVLLHDPEYQVRLCMSRKVAVLFETWDGHDELLQDVCGSFGVKMAKTTSDGRFCVGDVLQGPQEVVMAETAVFSLGEIAIASEQAENDVVFILCAHAAINVSSRPLVCAVLNSVGKQLKYPNRWKYMEQHLGQLLTQWVASNVNASVLLEVREVLVETPVERDFLQQCCPWLVPSLIYYERVDQIRWLATTLSLSAPALVKQHFQSIFAGILPLHLGSDEGLQTRAARALQVSMLELANISEDERDTLIQKRMVQIVGSLFRLCSARGKPQLPYFPKERTVLAIKTVVDGFFDSDQVSQGENVIDKMQVFRPDRVFKLLLELHFDLFTALHPRHRRNLLTSLAALIQVLDKRVIVPSTCRYLILIILQSIELNELQDQCCGLLSDVVGKLECSGLEASNQILGEQLQAIVSKLVSCCLGTGSGRAGATSYANDMKRVGSESRQSSTAFCLLRRLTVECDPFLHEYVKDLDPFPGFPCFQPMQGLLNRLSGSRSLAEDLVQFVRRIPSVPSKELSSSLKNLQDELRTRRKELYPSSRVYGGQSTKSWRCSPLVVDAVWKLVQLCDKHDDLDMKNLAGEFLAAVGVVDPHAVVFHLPDMNNELTTDLLETANGYNTAGQVNATTVDSGWELSDGLLRCIILQLRSYLIDSDVHVIQLASLTLKGLLSTEKGQRVFLSLNQQEKMYLELYPKGVNLKFVTEMVDAAKQKSAESAIPLDDPTIWQTSGVPYDVWVCTLTYSLLEHSNDTTLRLSQDILAVKGPLAELVFPHVFGSLAGEHQSGSELCTLISKQVEDHLFRDTNLSTRALQLFLNTLNILRQWFIHSGMKRMSPLTKRRDPAKVEKPAASGGKRTRKRISSTGASNGTDTGDQMDEDQTSWNKVYWLQIDYLSTARAAQQCAAYFTSVLYVEHWCEESFGSVTLGPPDFSSDDELPSHLELLLRAYTRINEPDGVYGVVRSHKVTSQLLRYEHEGNWSKALENYDLLLRTAKPTQFTKMNDMFSQQTHASVGEQDFSSKGSVLPNWQLHKGLMRTLQQKGCSHILEMYRCGVSQQESGLGLDSEFKEMQFEAAWRTGKWEDVNLKGISSKQSSLDPSTGSKGLCYHEHLYSSLKSLIEGDAEMYFSTLKMARQEIVTHIAHTSIESTQNVNPLIVKLQVLDCISQAWEMRWNVRHQSKQSIVNVPSENARSTVNGPFVPSREQIERFEESWQDNLKQMQGHYELAEPYIAVHKVLLELLNLPDHIPQHLLQFGSFCRKAGRLNHAGTAIHELKSICSETFGASDAKIHHIVQPISSRYCVAGRVEEAKILWAEGHQEMAVNLAKYVLQLKNDATDSALLLCLTGKWLAETRSSSSRVILDSYLMQAVELSKSQTGQGTDESRTTRRGRTHFRLAHYADALYRNHQERLTSSEWQSALRLRHHKTREYDALKERLYILRADPREDPVKIKEYSMKLVELHKQLTIDTEEAQHLQNDKDYFLSIALENYRSCLYVSNKYDLRVVFRLISLWFNLSTNEHVMESMLETVEKVQSYKFLPLVYQIASRLGGSKELQGHNNFQKALTFLLKKMATEHPYHCLYQLFALANGDRVKEKQRGKNVFVVDMEKKRAAEELLGSLTATHSDLLSQIKTMIEIYIRLAEMETTPKDANRKLVIPREIRNIRQLELVPVVTAQVPVDFSCQYQQDSFPHFKGFSEGIKIMNGINAPKYMECLGSDGNKYRQLAKSGNDDLRQDAVMEQLFGLVNELLQAHPDTRKRNLSIRTYKVVPFTPSAGVLEWVDGTIPVGEYLLGPTRLGGAHGRYGGDDWSFLACREHMCTEKDKRTAFETVLTNFRPVMHNFFLEKFVQAEDWFEKRLAYTRSVATSSMVGYIVGLGDRHSLNILLDQATAEVVHIDLGVAFEQGLMLKTPERIPFRLTRDVVDGMGVTGVEGVFRRCCEATLAVLRTNKEALLTIIEVFIYDPLYNWALSPLKALQRQQELEDLDDSNPDANTVVEMEGNKDAARALFRVKQKLDGYEEGEMRSLQGQVHQLIQDAQDPERLSQLFPGWGAWV
ncbi:unnamed protein product [Calypogeia fissa]